MIEEIGLMIGPEIPNSENSSPQETITTRNSMLRRIFAEPVGKLVTSIDRNFPRIQPDDLTETGLVLVLAADALAIKYRDNPAIPNALYTTLFTIGSIFDGFDGGLERQKHTERDKDSYIKGMLKDIKADKTEEIITFGALSYIARKRGNNFAANCYAFATMTAVLPSLYRAKAESKGLIVSEGGFGTRVGRGFMAGVGINFDRKKKTSNLVSAVVTANNLITAKERLSVIQNGDKASHYRGTDNDPSFIEAANARSETLTKFAKAGIAAGVVLLMIKPRKIDTD